MTAPWSLDSGSLGVDFVRSLGAAPLHVAWPAWADGVLSVALYATEMPPPDAVTTSIRCVVLDGDRVLVCETPHGSHLMPGGRREPGEAWEETVRREVREETGFAVGDLRQVAVILLHRDGGRPDGPAATYPHPDSFWVIHCAEAAGRDDDAWSDTEGWETGSRLTPIREARDRVDDLNRAALGLTSP